MTGWPAFTLAGKLSAVATSAPGVTVVTAVEVGVGLLLTSPAGGVTPATLVMLAAPAVPLTVNVTVPPFGKVGMEMPAPCKLATVSTALLGHTAPPETAVHATAVAVKLATAGSCTTVPFAASGPALATTSVYLTAAPPLTLAGPVFAIVRLARFAVSVNRQLMASPYCRLANV